MSFDKLGNIQLRLGNTDAALAHYQSGLAIDQTLAEQDPGNTQFQRDLLVSFNKLGDIQLRLGDTDAALEYFQLAFAIAKTLAKQDPGNAQHQSDLAYFEQKMAEFNKNVR